MSQSKKGVEMLTNSLVLFGIAIVATLTIIIIMSTGISGIADQPIQILTQN